jgi:hypothetical protein
MAFSPSDAAVEGLRVARANIGALVVWAVFYVAVIVLAVILIFAAMGPSFMDMAKGVGSTQDPAVMLKLIGGMMTGLLILVPLFVVVGAMITAAIFRAVLRPEDKGFAYLKLGGDEGRLIVVMFVMGLLIMLMYAACIALVWGLVSVTYNASHPLGTVVGILAGVAAFCVFVFVMVRLSLAPVMTFAERKIRIFESWGLTRGNFWRLLGMYVMVALIYFGVAFGLGMISFVFQMIGFGGMAAMSGQGDAAMAGAAPLAIVGAVIGFLVNMAGAALQLVIMNAPQAAAYRALSGTDISSAF